jgi:hypothetical protein
MTGTATSSERNNNDVNSLSLRQALEYCLDVLKIKENSEFYRNISAEFMSQTKVPLAMIKTHGNWITAMKLIADCSGMLDYNDSNNGHVFSQTQLYDFLALATRVIEGERVNNNNNNIILKMLRDITEDYGNFSDYLKSNYPGIIVDVISVINKGVDTKGIKVSSISIEKYYQSRKQQNQGTMTEEEREEQTTVTSASTSTTTAAAAIDKDQILPSLYSKNDLVEGLSQITNRKRKEIQESLARLQDSDLKRISDLCHNYSRLQHYTKLITKREGSQEQFKKEIQKEMGRKLRSHQLGRAANSIRMARTYIENILDNKFIPDASHGINHVKHNLEYGYQLMNLIERTRRRRQRIQ